jgi:hypothetical protein
MRTRAQDETIKCQRERDRGANREQQTEPSRQSTRGRERRYDASDRKAFAVRQVQNTRRPVDDDQSDAHQRIDCAGHETADDRLGNQVHGRPDNLA